MASRKHALTGVFPQRKKATVGAGKSKGDKVAALYQDASIVGGSVGSGSAQPAALITSRGGAKDVNDKYDQNEETLREFDMNMAYGPCLGITRMERWERANRLGLNPPTRVKDLLADIGASPDCLWEGRV